LVDEPVFALRVGRQSETVAVCNGIGKAASSWRGNADRSTAFFTFENHGFCVGAVKFHAVTSHVIGLRQYIGFVGLTAGRFTIGFTGALFITGLTAGRFITGLPGLPTTGFMPPTCFAI
jgi:hypothetical protein